MAAGEQRRLLLLVLSLGLVAVLAGEARKPQHWHWLTAPDGATANASTGSVAAEGGRQPSEQYFDGVQPRLFEAIRDNTTYRHAEREAWFHLLDILKRTDEATLRQESIGRVSFAQLFAQSDAYRGQLVSVRGTVRRAHRLSAPENDCGVAGYFRTWIQPADHRASPIVAYCLSLPEGFPIGMDILAEAEITGFYFKRWAYKAQDGLRTAPALLARTVHWQQTPPKVDAAPAGFGTAAAVMGFAFGVSLCVVAYVYLRTRSRTPVEPGLPPRFDGIDGIDDAESPGEEDPAAGSRHAPG